MITKISKTDKIKSKLLKCELNWNNEQQNKLDEELKEMKKISNYKQFMALSSVQV